LPWLFIYFASGIFGNMLRWPAHFLAFMMYSSCIFLPDAIGVGSSGAVMGMLSAWFVWIVFRWFVLTLYSRFIIVQRQKIPSECKSQRNCQLLMVTAAIALTVLESLILFHLSPSVGIFFQ
jgi:hypothetical protein